MTPERKIKHTKKAWREYNIRRRAFQQPELTLEEYLAIKLPVDYRGKINPRIKDGEQHMISVFGEHITTERKSCLKCHRVKPLIDFICRYKSKRIENICKDCDQSRKRKP